MASSIYSLSLTTNTVGTVTAVAIVSGGTGYTNGETVDIGGSGTGATGTATVAAGVITAISVVLAGTGYINGETPVTLTGQTSSQSNATGTITATIITANTDILSSDITFQSDEFVPGGAGLIRVWFSFLSATSPFNVLISHESGFTNPVKLNADNSFNIITQGFYRFDIPAKFGDSINIRASEILTGIPLLRFEKIVFGA